MSVFSCFLLRIGEWLPVAYPAAFDVVVGTSKEVEFLCGGGFPAAIPKRQLRRGWKAAPAPRSTDLFRIRRAKVVQPLAARW
jgi:hypothetical protein